MFLLKPRKATCTCGAACTKEYQIDRLLSESSPAAGFALSEASFSFSSSEPSFASASSQGGCKRLPCIHGTKKQPSTTWDIEGRTQKECSRIDDPGMPKCASIQQPQCVKGCFEIISCSLPISNVFLIVATLQIVYIPFSLLSNHVDICGRSTTEGPFKSCVFLISAPTLLESIIHSHLCYWATLEYSGFRGSMARGPQDNLDRWGSM